MKINKSFWILAGILLLGTILRLYKLGVHAIWFDEACSVTMSLNELNTHYFLNSFNYKPIYFLFLKLWIYIFGVGEFWLRLPSVIFAIISLLVIYLIGQKILNKKVGLIATFLLTISCFNIYHSQQTRQFTLMVLLVLLSYLYFINILKKNNPWSYELNTFFNILLIFTHPYSLVVIITQNIFMLSFEFKEKILKKRWIFYQKIIFFFILLWFFLSNKPYMFHSVWWIHIPNLSSIVETFQTFSYGGPRYGLEDFKINFSSPLIILILFFLWNSFFIVGLFSKYNKDYFTFKWTKFLLVFWLFIPIIIAFFVSFLRPVYLIKHLIVVLPAYCLLVALGIYKLKRKPIILSMFALLFLFNLYPLRIMFLQDFNTDWKQAAKYLKSKAKGEDVIIISTCAETNPFIYYFSSSPKDSLRNVNIDANTYAKLVDGKLLEAFYEKNILIVGIKQNQGQGVSFVKNDFEQKVKDIIINNKYRFSNIWLAVSRWTGPEEKEFMVDYLKNLFGNGREELFRGVTIYKFSKDR